MGSNQQNCSLNFGITNLIDETGTGLAVVIPNPSIDLRRGDARPDGNISIADALFIAQHIVAPLFRPAGEGAGDVHPVNAGSVKHDSPDDIISLADAIRIAQFLVGIRDEFYN